MRILYNIIREKLRDKSKDNSVFIICKTHKINLSSETCVCCGDIIPEGYQICYACRHKYNKI